jgi:hypothetical protein
VLDDKLAALIAELRAIDLWDQARETDLEDDIERAGFEARRIRRSEIVREINTREGREHFASVYTYPLGGTTRPGPVAGVISRGC